VSPETIFRGTNREINETIVAGRIHANNLMINPYLVIQVIGTDSAQIMIGKERNSTQCCYCKTTKHEIEKCRKRQYNNSRNNSLGSSRKLSRAADGASRIRPVNVIEKIESEEKNAES